MARPTRPLICALPWALVPALATAYAPAEGTTVTAAPCTLALLPSTKCTVTEVKALSISVSGTAPLVTFSVRSLVKQAPEMQLLLSPQAKPSVALACESLQVGGVVPQLSVPLWQT